MNGTDRLERELTTWFADTAAPHVPDYTADILGATATLPQRPRWTFPTRWLPAALVPRLPRVTVRPLSWRAIALLAVLGLLLAAALTLYVGSRPRVPPPFGPAANGLVAYAEDGDIWTVDPMTGIRTAVVTGVSNDTAPRYSRDGTRLAFFREEAGRVRLVSINADGSDMVVSGASFINADTDSINWSPNGQGVAIAAGPQTDRTMYLVDSMTGATRDLKITDVDMEVYWRPPDGRQLVYVSGIDADRKPFLLSIEDGTSREITIAEPGFENRPGGWTLDGARLVVHGYDDVYGWTDLLDPDTGDSIRLNIGFGRLSNDGTRIVGFRENGWSLCVMPASGGVCTEIAEGDTVPDWEHTAGLQWSPDDRWIVVYPQNGSGWSLLDPEGAPQEQPTWSELGLDSWQRVDPSRPWWRFW